MKSLEEIELLLEANLNHYLPIISSIPQQTRYYNQYLDMTSAILVRLLDLHLREDKEEWAPGKLMDDALLTDIILTDTSLSIEGIAIWGVGGGITEQWTEPFLFEVAIHNNKVDFTSYSFLFGDDGKPAVPYSYFSNHRHIWEKTERYWRYKISTREEGGLDSAG